MSETTEVTLKQDIENVDWQALADVYGETLGPEDPAQLKRTWTRSYATVLAYAEGRLVGAARAISDGEREALIVGVVVLPAYQRKGIGSRMMAALTETVQGTAILLTCEEDENVPFYEKAGFRAHKRVMALGYRGGYAE
ncbi:MAG: GNAT family N-acetyltransferase [Chloroflexi bacterium]|nr:GNAT family N-acetyltransferase [Chloroflexota bacterium]